MLCNNLEIIDYRQTAFIKCDYNDVGRISPIF